jgi:hypothetical protein
MLDNIALLAPLKRNVRHLRKRVTPRRYKEGFVNLALSRIDSRESLYLEIGVRAGESLMHARAGRRVGVDPSPQISQGSLGIEDQVFALSSDEFFDGGSAEKALTRKVDVALIDGLHEFRQALRDTINASRFMAKDGVIVIDDCNPEDAYRAADIPTGSAWNGDVWKVMAIIRETQPQWRAITIDSDQGVGLIWGFDQEFREIDPALIDSFKELEYGVLAKDRGRNLGLLPNRLIPFDFPPAIQSGS